MTVNGDAYATKLVEQISQPGGNRITQTFDTLARLLATERRSPGAPGTVLDSATYQYDSRHGRTKQTLADNSYLDCTYDLAGQLDPAFAKNSGGGAVTGEQFDYGYDAGRNMTTRPTGTGMTADDSDDLCGWVERATRPFSAATCRRSVGGRVARQNSPVVCSTRNPDPHGGAGGIGGLLARSVHSGAVGCPCPFGERLRLSSTDGGRWAGEWISNFHPGRRSRPAAPPPQRRRPGGVPASLPRQRAFRRSVRGRRGPAVRHAPTHGLLRRRPYFDPNALAIVKIGSSNPNAKKPMAAATRHRIAGSIRRTA